MTLRTRLLLPYLLIVLVLVALFLTVSLELNRQEENLETVSTRSREILAVTQQLATLHDRVAMTVLSRIFDPENASELLLEQVEGDIDRQIEQLTEKVVAPDNQELFSLYLESHRRSLELRRRLMEAQKEPNLETRRGIFFAWQLETRQRNAYLQDFQTLVTKKMRLSLQAIQTVRDKVKLLITATLAVILSLSIVSWFFLDRSVLTRLFRLQEDMRAIGTGNLLHPVMKTGHDEITELAFALDDLKSRLNNSTVSLHFLDSIVGSLRDPLFVFDSSGKLRTVNPAGRTLPGGSSPELIGGDLVSILDRLQLSDPETGAPFTARNTAGLDPSQMHLSAWPVMRQGSASDETQWYLLTLSPLSSADNQREMGTVLSLREYTQLKRSELELIKKAQELERSNHDLEQFSYVASHDLQEPLRKVSSFCQLLVQECGDSLSPDARQYIDFIVDGAKRMQTLVADLLEFSRVGRGDLKAQRLDSEAVVAQALDSLMFTIEDSRARITKDELPRIFGNENEIMRLFQNLLSNSLKYRSERDPVIHISARPDGENWLFSIHDNGIGIAPSYSESIFILFKRLHGREKYPGTGIGLALCKKIVERHGGRIWVDSQLGNGSTFYFTLPRA